MMRKSTNEHKSPWSIFSVTLATFSFASSVAGYKDFSCESISINSTAVTSLSCFDWKKESPMAVM